MPWLKRLRPIGGFSASRHAFILGCLFVCSAGFALSRLDHTPFWDDEALAGIQAKNVLNEGRLTAWDGRNLVAYRNGMVLDEQLRTRDAPLHYWITAGSFRLFGISTWAGRFPSVVAGLLALAAFGRLLLTYEKTSPVHAVYAFGLMAFSVVFLLNIRQCRYYALVLLFCTLSYLAYRAFLAIRRPIDLALLTTFALCAFYTSYLAAISFLLAMAATHLICHRRELSPRAWLMAAGAGAVLLAATVPYCLAHKVWARPDITLGMPTPLHSWPVEKLILLGWNLRELNTLNCLPWPIVVGLVWLAYRRRNDELARKAIFPWALICLFYLITLVALYPQSAGATGLANVRFFLPLLPFATGLAGWALAWVHQWQPGVAVTLFAVITCTNVLSLAPSNRAPRWLLPAYINELRQDYPTGYGAAVDFLQRHAAKDDLVYAFEDYHNYPLMFHLGDRVRFCCLLDKRTPLPHHVIRSLNAPLFLDENFPDWLIAFGVSDETRNFLSAFARPHEEKGQWAQNQYRFVTNLNVYWDDTSRPELPWHSFGPKLDFARDSESVYVFRRMGR